MQHYTKKISGRRDNIYFYKSSVIELNLPNNFVVGGFLIFLCENENLCSKDLDACGFLKIFLCEKEKREFVFNVVFICVLLRGGLLDKTICQEA
jgi:hypothetical protein